MKQRQRGQKRNPKGDSFGGDSDQLSVDELEAMKQFSKERDESSEQVVETVGKAKGDINIGADNFRNQTEKNTPPESIIEEKEKLEDLVGKANEFAADASAKIETALDLATDLGDGDSVLDKDASAEQSVDSITIEVENLIKEIDQFLSTNPQAFEKDKGEWFKRNQRLFRKGRLNDSKKILSFKRDLERLKKDIGISAETKADEPEQVTPVKSEKPEADQPEAEPQLEADQSLAEVPKLKSDKPKPDQIEQEKNAEIRDRFKGFF